MLFWEAMEGLLLRQKDLERGLDGAAFEILILYRGVGQKRNLLLFSCFHV